jgi:hypothetical protein
MARDYSTMTVRQLEELRTLMLDRIASVPEFRRGSLQVGYRKCGKATCRCARPGEQGHGPRGLWTRTAKGPGGSRGQYIPVEQVDQVRAELDNYAQFAALVEDYVEVNEELCKARLGPPARRPRRVDPAAGGEKGGSAVGPGKSRASRKG